MGTGERVDILHAAGWALLAAVAAAVMVGAERWWDILFSEQPPADSTSIIVVAALWSAGAAMAAGMATYFPLRRQRSDAAALRQRDQEARRQARAAEDVRTGLLSMLVTATAAHALLVQEIVAAGVSAPTHNAAGQLQSTVVSLAENAVRQMHREDVRVRVAYVRRHPDRTPQWAIEGVAGRHLDYRIEDGGPFAVAVAGMLDATDPPLVYGPRAEAGVWQLPGDADRFARVPVTLGPYKFGLLCVDIWGSTNLDQENLLPLMSLARILSSGLVMATLQALGTSPQGCGACDAEGVDRQ
jgi:hypothetical protein